MATPCDEAIVNAWDEGALPLWPPPGRSEESELSFTSGEAVLNVPRAGHLNYDEGGQYFYGYAKNPRSVRARAEILSQQLPRGQCERPSVLYGNRLRCIRLPSKSCELAAFTPDQSMTAQHSEIGTEAGADMPLQVW